MNRKLFTVLLFMLLALLGAGQASGSPSLAPAAPLPQPTNISCQGYERDTVLVYWQDTATDETNYRVERSIGGGAWSEVATKTPDAAGNYDGYRETGVDVSTQNRRYRVRSYRSSDNSYSPYSDICNNRRIYEPGNFRFFYGLRGTSDDCPLIDGKNACLADVSSGGVNIYLNRSNTALQGSVDAFTRVGFTRNAAVHGTLDKIPINVVWCDGGGCAGGGGLGLSPLLLETSFDPITRVGDPVAWIVALHEAFHFQQFKYWGLNDPSDTWVVEGQARSIQDKLCIGANRPTAECFDDIATGYAGYVPEVVYYLGNANWPILKHSYSTALFWTYLTEKYGTSSPADTVEGGMNLMVRFWEDSAATPGRDGVTVLNSVLAGLGHTKHFRDIWKDFAVANYAKDLSGPHVPAKYRYADMAQPGGTYGPVTLSLDQALNVGSSAVDSDETVYPWGARYYQVRPAASVPIVNITFTQDSAVQVYYMVMGIRGTDLVYSYSVESRNLALALVNDHYDKVAVVVAGLENLANYRYSFNGTQPTLRILDPTTSNKARVGSPTAPDKFRVSVEVLTPAGTPMPGVSLSNFRFRVGTQDVPTSSILVSATIMSQQWFILRAPVQASAGMYDLQVRYSTLVTGTQAQAVNYTPRLDADNMLIVDRSGSMAASGKMDAAKAAAHLFVDSWRPGDKIGVISFNELRTVDLSLRNWTTNTVTGGSRQEAFDAVDALTAGGCTNIGDPLRAGWDQLKTLGNAGHDWALVLLSDGKEECSSPVENFDTMIWKLDTATTKRPVVHSVAIGADADRVRMQRVAAVTGGTYQYVSTPSPLLAANSTAAMNMQLDLDYRHRLIAADILGLQPFFKFVGPDLNDGNDKGDIVTIPVEGSAAEMILSLSGSTAGMEWRLNDPFGNRVDEFERDGSRHAVWRVPTPTPGDWKLTVYFSKPYLVQGSLRSDVTLDVYLPTPIEERRIGVPMPILASLTDIAPITGAAVRAEIDTPSGATFTRWLYDDGAHGDGGAANGLYGNTFYQTGWCGSYNVTVYASGVSSVSGAFTRQKTVSFHLDCTLNANGQPEDQDQDGLPDEWERRNGTDPTKADDKEDPDNDGRPNGEERDGGTDPHNSDSDNGGESDGTDADPRDPSDDAIDPTWGEAYPGVGKVILRYTVRPTYTVIGIYRGHSLLGPFAFHDQDLSVDGVYSDTNVANGQTYCYDVRAQDSSGHQSGGLMPTCATPKEDPLGPHGGLLINGGASATCLPDVTLTLWASDAVDPEVNQPGAEVFLPPPDSATGVVDMMISNRADMSDGVWEPYATTKSWTLAQTSGLAAVFVKYRDAAGNESAVAKATIQVSCHSIYLPAMFK